MAAPQTIDWSRLSPANMEIVQQVGLRMTAGFSLDEIAAELNRTLPALHHELPAVVGKAWVSARMRGFASRSTRGTRTSRTSRPRTSWRSRSSSGSSR